MWGQFPSRRFAIILPWASIAIVVLQLHAAEVKENYDDGKPKLHYRTDDKDRRVGIYEEFHPNGKIMVRGLYTAGKKNGRWQTFDENGKVSEASTYRNDLLDGLWTWNFPSGKPALKAIYSTGQLAGPITVWDEKGKVVRLISYPRTRQAVQKAFDTLYSEETPCKFVTEPQVSPPYKAGVLTPDTLEAGLKLTKLYRYASGLRWDDLKIDPELCDVSAHGAVVLSKIGMLTHTPDKPSDMSEDFFRLAYAGCHEANLYSGRATVTGAVHAWMDDSDGTNMAMVGHRQWALAPSLQHIGFGVAGGFASMHILDGNRASKFEFNFIAYPGEGYYPVQLLSPHAGWSLHFNKTKVTVGTPDSLKISLQKLDDHYQPEGDAIAAKVVSCPGPISPYFGCTVVIFKPELDAITPGKYWVNVDGVRTAAGAATPFGYLVEFFDPIAAQTAAK